MLRFEFNYLCCMVVILCINLLCGESFNMNKCVETERQALFKFKDALIYGRNKRITSWQGKDCCKWEGISCDNLTGHVTGLNLSDLDFIEPLRGKLDSSICELQHLTSFNLRSNLLKGKIPECIGSLGKLIELNLNDNVFVGVIPPSLGNLSNLQTLDLAYNDGMSVNDFEWLSRLSNLKYLNLTRVNLTLVVDWLSPISKISSLSELRLSGCGLHNITQKSISHLNSSISLKYLDLGENSLNSSILPWVINVSKFLTHLDLSSNSLQQSIPYEFGNMIFLQYLDLSSNEIQGSIPKSFMNMCQLKDLRINFNKLSGQQLKDNIEQLCCANNGLKNLDMSENPFKSGPLPNLLCFPSLVTLSLQNTNVVSLLPKSIFHLSFLQGLYLSHNHLNGVDIIDDAKLSILSALDLSFNQLSGSMSLFEITKLTSLQVLDISHNQLSGPLPVTIGQLSNLTWLFLSSNNLNGVINETHLSNLSQLNVLDVSQNLLSIKLNLDPPFKLESLYASSCLLGPNFPIWLKHQKELTHLEMSNSGISDSFPEWFWNLSLSLEYLNVSHNKLSGPLPKSFPSSKVNYNHVWDFSFNNLNGSLPPFPELGALFLSNNMFTGSLSSFCTSSSHRLIYIDVSSNLLVGKLPDCWGKFQYLVVLNLENNNLSGKLPNSLGVLQQIESLHLNNNNFSGEIPSLILCHNLKLIDVGDNSLQGILPAWIGNHLHRLTVIRLRANNFQGSIPTSMCNLSFLQVLDLSENNITGKIPQCFGDIIALSNLKSPRIVFHHDPITGYGYSYFASENFEIASYNDKEMLSWKGTNREYETNLGLMTTIDLSCNRLTGEIPQSITKLVALISLNLSRNNLTGIISNNIGQMKSLESLDLSRNHLFGRMPISFSNLTFLNYMNLSFNNFEGEIPLSTQLQSLDPSSFVGNDRLCGPPLIKLCHDGVISPTRSHDKHTSEDEDKLRTFGFYVSLGLGFIVGFWGVCGTLVIKTSWRHAYFKFFKKINDWIQVTLVVFLINMKNRFQVEDPQVQFPLRE